MEEVNQSSKKNSEKKISENKKGQNPNQRKPEIQKQKNIKKRYVSRKRKPTYKASQRHYKKFNFKKVSIVIPLLNEEESIKPLIQQIKGVIHKINIAYEIFFIDDGSTDSSLEIIKELALKDKRIRYVSFRKNYGKSAALNVGFRDASGDVIITMDADLQDDPNEIPNLLEQLQKGYDMVSGWKKKRFDPLIKRQSSKFFNYATRVISGIKIHDFNCGLKAYRSPVVKSIRIYGELHRYIPVLAAWQGFKIGEIPVRHHARRYGKTKFGISRFFKGFIDLITVFFTTRYIKRPLHFFGVLGSLSFFLGLIINGYLSYQWFFHHVNLSNRPLLFLGMLLIIVGVQFFSIGLIGEMLVHNNIDDSEYNIKEKK